MRTKPKTKPALHEWRKPMLQKLSIMPRLSHWPNKPDKFDPELSEVYDYICAELHVGLDACPAILAAANHAKAVSYDKTIGLWCGSNYDEWVTEQIAWKERMLRVKSRVIQWSPEVEHLHNMLKTNGSEGSKGVTPNHTKTVRKSLTPVTLE